MKITRREVSRNWIYVIFSLVIGFLLILAIVFSNGENHVDNSIQYYTDFIVEDSKRKVESEVDNRLDEIYYDMGIVEKEEKDTVEGKIRTLETALISQDISMPDSKEGQEEFIQIFKEFVQTDTEHQYFVVNSEGDILVSSTVEYMEKMNLNTVKDEDGYLSNERITDAINTSDGIFVEYMWPKTKDSEPIKKTSYCRYIKKYDLIIGTGFYYEDIMKDLQEKTIQRLLSYYEGNNSYIFLTTYEGIAKVSQVEGRIGKKYFDSVDTPEWELHQDIMAICETGEGGFVTYEYYDKNADEKLKKISYVSGIDEWQMYIGMGVYTEDLSVLSENYAEEFSENQSRELWSTVIVLFLVAVFVYYFVRRGIHLFRGYMEQEEGIYKELFSISYEAIFVLSKKGKVLHKNLACINLFNNKLEDYIIDGKLVLEASEDEYYILTTENGTKYLSYREEVFRFNLEDAVIYFVQDVTDTILKTQEKELLAMKDVLTGAYNRRALIHDIDVLKNKNYEISLTIGIIDIDFFKKVNDTYGHSKGDEVLKLLTDKFHSRLRSVDRFYRYGGEEFIVSFQDTELIDAKRILEKINVSFSEDVYQMLGEKTTFSGGVVKESIKRNTDLDILIQEADKLLYQAKENGRNQINIGH